MVFYMSYDEHTQVQSDADCTNRKTVVSLSLAAMVVEGWRYKGRIVAAGANIPLIQNNMFS